MRHIYVIAYCYSNIAVDICQTPYHLKRIRNDHKTCVRPSLPYMAYFVLLYLSLPAKTYSISHTSFRYILRLVPVPLIGVSPYELYTGPSCWWVEYLCNNKFDKSSNEENIYTQSYWRSGGMGVRVRISLHIGPEMREGFFMSWSNLGTDCDLQIFYMPGTGTQMISCLSQVKENGVINRLRTVLWTPGN